jgi:hypothetical protein
MRMVWRQADHWHAAPFHSVSAVALLMLQGNLRSLVLMVHRRRKHPMKQMLKSSPLKRSRRSHMSRCVDGTEASQLLASTLTAIEPLRSIWLIHIGAVNSEVPEMQA